MDQAHLRRTLEHTAATLLIAAESDHQRAHDLRHLAAQIQVMTERLERPSAGAGADAASLTGGAGLA